MNTCALTCLCPPNRYLDQFRDLFTEEGRRLVKITTSKPGQPEQVVYTAIQTASTAQATATSITITSAQALLKQATSMAASIASQVNLSSCVGCSNQTPPWEGNRLFKSDTSMVGEQVVQIRHLCGRGTGCSNQTPPWEGNRLFKPDTSMGGEQVKLSWCMDHLLLKQPTSVPASIAPPSKPALCGSSAQTCHLHGSFHSPLHKTAVWRSSSAQTAYLGSFCSLPGKWPCVDHPLLKQATSMASSTAFCVKVACWGRPLLLLQWKCPAVKMPSFFLLTGTQPYSSRNPPQCRIYFILE